MGSSFLEGPCLTPLWVSSVLARVLMLRGKVLMLQLILGLSKVHLHLREQKVSPTDSSEGFIPLPYQLAATCLYPAPCRGLC